MFGRRLLTPDQNRTPAYDSLAAHNAGNPETSRWFGFQCANCPEEVKLDLPSYVGTYSDQESVLGAAQAELIRLHFGLRDGKSLAEGWPKFRVETCRHCSASYLVYIAVFEPANGWYKIVPQGITQLPSNYSFKATVTGHDDNPAPRAAP